MSRYIVITTVYDIFMGMCCIKSLKKKIIFFLFFLLRYKRFAVQRIGKQISDAYIHVMGVVALCRSLIRVYAHVHKYSENPPPQLARLQPPCACTLYRSIMHTTPHLNSNNPRYEFKRYARCIIMLLYS